MTCQYGISVVVLQTSIHRETRGGLAKCGLFSQTILFCGFFLCPWDRLRPLLLNWGQKKILKIFIFAEISGSLTHSVPGCPCSKPSSPQCSPQLSRSSLFSGPSRRGAGVMYTGDTSMRVHECCCCCCNEDLLKLQVTRLVLCLRCWTTWRQKQKGKETKKNATIVVNTVEKSANLGGISSKLRSRPILPSPLPPPPGSSVVGSSKESRIPKHL